VTLFGWEGNRWPRGKIAAYHQVYDYVTRGLTAYRDQLRPYAQY